MIDVVLVRCSSQACTIRALRIGALEMRLMAIIHAQTPRLFRQGVASQAESPLSG